ncbi:MAG: NAD(+)/NADH kinase [Eubacteriaceae bacterium]|nr:NAD(+)/NADH kinase [Eubacteriaceae bacterium]
MKKIVVYANHQKDPEYEFLSKVVSLAEKHGISSCVFGAESLPERFVKADSSQLKECFAAIALGGDGTMLNAISAFSGYNLAFIGINLGTLGFLADVAREDMAQRLEMLFAGQYYIEDRMMAQVSEGNRILGDVLNEAMIKHKLGEGTGDFKCWSGNALIGNYSADGVLVAAPTGSTAYSLSAGGPIVNPACDMLIIQPIAPHSLNSRSIIASVSEVIHLEFNPQTTHVFLDGESHTANSGRLTVKASPNRARFIKFDDYDFYGLLFKKIKETNYFRGGLT